jgi:hypothetical protein
MDRFEPMVQKLRYIIDPNSYAKAVVGFKDDVYAEISPIRLQIDRRIRDFLDDLVLVPIRSPNLSTGETK